MNIDSKDLDLIISLIKELGLADEEQMLYSKLLLIQEMNKLQEETREKASNIQDRFLKLKGDKEDGK